MVAIAAFSAALWLSPAKPKPSVRPGGLITEVTAQQVLEHVLSAKSPVVLVNFWASWCEPCKQEFPELLQLREKWAAKGLSVIFVSIDDPDDLPAAEAFLHEQHVNFETFTKGAQPLSFVTEIYPKWEGAVPTTLLFNPQAKLLDAWEGDATLAEFEEHITHQLGGT